MTYPNFPFEGRGTAGRPEEKARDDFIDLERLLHIAMRQAKALVACAVLGLLVGVVYLQTTPPTYTSVARVLIDDDLSRIADDESPSLASNMQSHAAVLSEVEVLKSTRLASAVVEKLKLDENENFLHPPVSLLARMIGTARWVKDLVLPSRGPPTGGAPESAAGAETAADGQRRQAAQALQSQVRAERVGRSYVIAIVYQSHDPRLAAAITDAYSQAYLDDQLNASFDATEQATVWLQARLAELRESSQAAAREVEDYRAKHGLTAARGELIADQQLAELSAQLIEAQADTARAMARYEQYRSIVEGRSGGAIEEAIANAVVPSELPPGSNISALRTRYLDILKRQRQIEADFGADHPQAVALGKESEELAQQVLNELKQLTQSYRNEYEVAQARETSLRSSVAEARGESADASQSQVQLRELEQRSAALSSLYQTFLNRYERATQQQSFPVGKARIISMANLPRNPSEPRTIMVLGLALVLGAIAGAMVGALNEFNERFFRTGDDVTERLGLKFLGYLPLVGRPRGKARRFFWPTIFGSRDKPSGPALDSRARMRITLDQPSSMFAETLRNVKIASDVVLQKVPNKVIGVVSVLPGEGKSTTAANLARLLASNNSRTLLIDADLRNPALTRGLGIETETGLVESIMDTRSWRSMLKFDRRTKLAILPGMVRGHFSHTSEALSSAGMGRLIQDARSVFDYIIVDLPPLGPVVDAKAFAPFADGLVVVVEWGSTPRALVRAMLASEPAIAEKVLGVVLNKVQLDALPRYGAFGSSEQFLTKYASYYIDERQPKAAGNAPVTKKATAPADP